MNESAILQAPHMLTSNTLARRQPTDLQLLGFFSFSQSIRPFFLSLRNFKPLVGYLNCSLNNTNSRSKQALWLHLPDKPCIQITIHCLLLHPDSWVLEEKIIQPCRLLPPKSMVSNITQPSLLCHRGSQSFYLFCEVLLNIFFVSDSPHWIQRNKSTYPPGWCPPSRCGALLYVLTTHQVHVLHYNCHVILPVFCVCPTRQFLLLESQAVSCSSVFQPRAQSLENGKCSLTIYWMNEWMNSLMEMGGPSFIPFFVLFPNLTFPWQWYPLLGGRRKALILPKVWVMALKRQRSLTVRGRVKSWFNVCLLRQESYILVMVGVSGGSPWSLVVWPRTSRHYWTRRARVILGALSARTSRDTGFWPLGKSSYPKLSLQSLLVQLSPSFASFLGMVLKGV